MPCLTPHPSCNPHAMPDPEPYPPATRRLFDLIPAAFIGRPTHYVVHAHGAPLQPMLAQLLTAAAALGSTPTAATTLDDTPAATAGRDTDATAAPAEVYVWIDIVAVCQHRPFNAQSDLTTEVKDIARACEGGK